MNEKISGTDYIEKLAVEGGKPIREKFITPIVEISREAKNRIIEVLNSGNLSNWYGGTFSREFEEMFADYYGLPFALAVNSGTSALHVAYAAANIGPGDEIIVPSCGYISAASAAIQQGALPVICDIESQTFGMSPSDLEKRITQRTKLIVLVHMWGIPNNVEGLIKIAQKYAIPVIEDCGQAHGAKYKNKLVGTFGDMATFSFAPRKHISTGQGGMVIFKNGEHAKSARSAANKGKGHGWHDYYRLGYSYVMCDIEALIGIDGLKKLDVEVKKRRRAAEIYHSFLKDSGLILISIPKERYSCYFKYPFSLPPEYIQYKQFMINALLAENISTRASHPPMHKIPWLADYVNEQAKENDSTRTSRPIADKELKHIIEIETGPGMNEDDFYETAKGVNKVWNRIKDMHREGIIPKSTGEIDLCV